MRMELLQDFNFPPVLAEWVRTHPEEDKGLWMLKNNKQRGTGLRLVRTSDAFAACFETTKRPGLEGVMLYRCVASVSKAEKHNYKKQVSVLK